MTERLYKSEEVRAIVEVAGRIGQSRDDMRCMSRDYDIARRFAGGIGKYKYFLEMINKYPEFLSADMDALRGTIKNMERAIKNT